MQRSRPSLFARHDTFLGVCEAIGQDFRIHANYLRLAFAVGLLLSPMVALACYIGLGVIVVASRLIAPSRPSRQPAAAHGQIVPLKGDNDEATADLAAAA